MRMSSLVRRLDGASLAGDGTIAVSGISHDSRRIGRGMVFAALEGQRAHGLQFLDEAVANGAVAVLSDRRRPRRSTLAWITTPAPRRALAIAAWALAGDPQRGLYMVGVTGTNGKSTTAHLIHLIFDAAGRTSALFGTVNYVLPGGDVRAAERTTPEASDLAPMLRRTVTAGGGAAILEVSSHALMQDRLAGLSFQVAVWTNLSRDHLDFHGDMENYYRAKRRLFDELLATDGHRVLPLDDPWGARMLDEPRSTDVTWGLTRGDIHADQIVSDLEGTRCQLHLVDSVHELHLPLIGVHNLRNALAAAAAATAAGIGSGDIVRALAHSQPLPGRLEVATRELPFPVLVDFAHTPDGLAAVLQSLRKLTSRRLIVVFGAGGDRDPGKRGPMGFAVGELADVAIVTSDNPRSEDPATIADAVIEGVRAAGGEPLVILDRRQAIATAFELADSSSLVLIAGKGHEATQTIGDRKLPFSDQEVARELAGGVPCG